MCVYVGLCICVFVFVCLCICLCLCVCMCELKSGLPFGLFWICLPEIKWFGHISAFNKVEENITFKGLFWTNLKKITISYKILKYVHLVLQIVFERLAFTGPFFILENLAFFETALIGKFGLFNFFGPGNPGSSVHLDRWRRNILLAYFSKRISN